MIFMKGGSEIILECCDNVLKPDGSKEMIDTAKLTK